MGAALRTLGVPTDAPVNNVILPPEGSEIARGNVTARPSLDRSTCPRCSPSSARSPRRITRGQPPASSPAIAFAAYPGARRDGRAFVPDAIARGAGAVLWETRAFHWDRAVERAASRRRRACRRSSASSPTSSTAVRRSDCGWSASPAPTARPRARTGSRRRSTRAAAAPRSSGTLGNGLVGALGAGDAHDARRDASCRRCSQQFRAAGAQAVGDGSVVARARPGPRQRRRSSTSRSFTNLTRDHLDYHSTMAAYGAGEGEAVHVAGPARGGDQRRRRVRPEPRSTRRARAASGCSTYGFANADIAATAIAIGSPRHRARRGDAVGQGDVDIDAVVGAFNAQNLLGVLARAAGERRAARRCARRRSAGIAPPAGRMQRLGGDDQPLVVVDYAHTPDALEKVLLALQARGRRRRRARLRVRLRRRSRSPASARKWARIAGGSPTASSSPATTRAARIRRSIASAVVRGIRDTRPIAAGRSRSIARAAIAGAIAAREGRRRRADRRQGTRDVPGAQWRTHAVLGRRGVRGGARRMERRMMDTATAARVVAGQLDRRQRALPARDDRQPRAARGRSLRRAERRALRRSRLRRPRRSAQGAVAALVAQRSRAGAAGRRSSRSPIRSRRWRQLAAYWRAQFTLPLVVDRRQQRQDDGEGNARGDPARAFRRRARARDRRAISTTRSACR